MRSPTARSTSAPVGGRCSGHLSRPSRSRAAPRRRAARVRRRARRGLGEERTAERSRLVSASPVCDRCTCASTNAGVTRAPSSSTTSSAPSACRRRRPDRRPRRRGRRGRASPSLPGGAGTGSVHRGARSWSPAQSPRSTTRDRASVKPGAGRSDSHSCSALVAAAPVSARRESVDDLARDPLRVR